MGRRPSSAGRLVGGDIQHEDILRGGFKGIEGDMGLGRSGLVGFMKNYRALSDLERSMQSVTMKNKAAALEAAEEAASKNGGDSGDGPAVGPVSNGYEFWWDSNDPNEKHTGGDLGSYYFAENFENGRRGKMLGGNHNNNTGNKGGAKEEEKAGNDVNRKPGEIAEDNDDDEDNDDSDDEGSGDEDSGDEIPKTGESANEREARGGTRNEGRGDGTCAAQRTNDRRRSLDDLVHAAFLLCSHTCVREHCSRRVLPLFTHVGGPGSHMCTVATDKIWLTSSELMMEHTQENAKARSTALELLPEKAIAILKMNTLKWLKARGKGGKMETEMDRVRMLRDWFEALDADGSGDISVDELEEPLISIGLVGSKDDLENMISKYDSSGDGEIDFQEFVKMVMTKEDNGESNAMLKLFEAFSEGTLGDKLLPFSTLVHMYSRKMLFNAVDGRDEKEKAEGQQVLRARVKRIEAREYDAKMAKQKTQKEKSERRCSMKVALGVTSNTIVGHISDTLGSSSRFTKEEVDERRSSMRRNSTARRASLVGERPGGSAALG